MSNVNTKDGDDLVSAAKEGNIEKVKELLTNGVSVNAKNKFGFTALMLSSGSGHIQIVKLLLRKGADVNAKTKNNITALMLSSNNGKTEIVELLIDANADLNIINDNLHTSALLMAIKNNRKPIVKLLIDAKADLNIKDGEGNTALMIAIQIKDIESIKLLLDAGAKFDDKNKKDETPLDLALQTHDESIIALLKQKEEKKKELWKGFTKPDIDKFDIFFDNPNDWSLCPVCLKFAWREAGCMYMTHDCSIHDAYYDKNLYDTYRQMYTGSPLIEWCTVCGRISDYHEHYKLVSFDADKPKKETIRYDLIQAREHGDNRIFYDNNNCKHFGGGGIEEKVSRFRRLREYALELQDDIDKKEHNEVMQELIEEVWNAPLRRETKKIAKIIKDKVWNIASSSFPNVHSRRNNNNNKNKNKNSNIPFNGKIPTIVHHGMCAVGLEDPDEAGNPLYQFHHEDIGGVDHKDTFICKNDLIERIKLYNTQYGTLDAFGKCWNYSQCLAKMHPEEVKDIIPKELYEKYKEIFNKKMKQKGGSKTRKNKKCQKGAGKKNVMQEIDPNTITCSLPLIKKK